MKTFLRFVSFRFVQNGGQCLAVQLPVESGLGGGVGHVAACQKHKHQMEVQRG